VIEIIEIEVREAKETEKDQSTIIIHIIKEILTIIITITEIITIIILEI
jgi:hypothetical protein